MAFWHSLQNPEGKTEIILSVGVVGWGVDCNLACNQSPGTEDTEIRDMVLKNICTPRNIPMDIQNQPFLKSCRILKKKNKNTLISFVPNISNCGWVANRVMNSRPCSVVANRRRKFMA